MFWINKQMTPKKFYANTRRRAKVIGLSLRKLAEAAEMNPSQLSRAMNNHIDPLLTTMVRIETALERYELRYWRGKAAITKTVNALSR